jgi:hypothetical protein
MIFRDNVTKVRKGLNSSFVPQSSQRHNDIYIMDRILESKEYQSGATLILFRIFASHIASSIRVQTSINVILALR